MFFFLISRRPPSHTRTDTRLPYTTLVRAHVAAITPGTNLGAATPIQIGVPEQPDSGDKGGKELGAHERKAVNDAVAYIRSLAELRGRNAQWAEQAEIGRAHV